MAGTAGDQLDLGGNDLTGVRRRKGLRMPFTVDRADSVVTWAWTGDDDGPRERSRRIGWTRRLFGLLALLALPALAALLLSRDVVARQVSKVSAALAAIIGCLIVSSLDLAICLPLRQAAVA